MSSRVYPARRAVRATPRRHALCLLLVAVAACGGGAPPARPPESTAFVQDPARPNIVYGTVGTLDGVPEVGLKDGREVTVDGTSVGSAEPKKKSDAVGRVLQEKRSPSGRAAYAFDRDTPWSLARSILDSAAKAGYPHASFVTRTVKESVGRPSHLDVEVATEKKTTTERQLQVTLSARGAVMLRWLEGTKQIGDVISTDAVVTRLAPNFEREHNERGLYREADDKRFDQIILRVEPDAPYILVITVLDAISGTKRGSVSAFVVNLPAEDTLPVPTIGSSPARPR